MVIFIVPAYNEEENIGALLENTIMKMKSGNDDFKIIIVNDGSIDRTLDVIAGFQNKNLPIDVINFESNKGVGAAFMAGFKKSLELAREGDIIVTKEADNTSDLAILDKMTQKIKDGYDVVLASCFAQKGEVINSSWERHMFSFFGNLLLRIFFPIKGLNTYSSFYRAFNAETLKKVFKFYGDNIITEKGYVCVVEMLVKLSRLPIKIGEIPMVLNANRRVGFSKMKRIKTISGYLRVIRKEAFRGINAEKFLNH